MNPITRPITPEIAGVLAECTFDGAVMYLPERTLSRSLYTRVDGVLSALGGEWKRGLKGHVFPTDAKALVDKALGLGGAIDEAATHRKLLQQFWTPEWLAKTMAGRSSLRNQRVLEPNAGTGRLVDAALEFGPAEVTAIELDAALAGKLMARHAVPDSKVSVICQSFLTWRPKVAPTRILMNPPFSGGQDISHVTHAIDILAPGGRLAAVLPVFRFDERKSAADAAFRALLKTMNCQCEMLPPNAFREAGTDYPTSLIFLNKPR